MNEIPGGVGGKGGGFPRKDAKEGGDAVRRNARKPAKKDIVTRKTPWHVPALILQAAMLSFAPPAFVDAAENPGAKQAEEISPAAADPNRLSREGLVVDFSVTPAPVPGERPREVLAGSPAEVVFRITDEGTGKPVRSLYPGAWVDLAKPWEGEGAAGGLPCKERVSLYLGGNVGIRPLVDLNSFFVLVLNRDPSISVIDPRVGITGITKLFTTIPLKAPGADWTKTRDDKRLFVTLPSAGKVAVVNADTFKVTGHIDAGKNPVRIVLQPDGRYLWVGNDAEGEAESGVTVIDAAEQTVAARIPTGGGHHEIAFSPDSRHAFVTNRRDGTVSVIDVRNLKKVKDVPVGEQAISLGYSASSESLYAADGQTGTIVVIDGRAHAVTARIEARPGLGPMKFTADGRWGFVVNSRDDAVHVIDASTNRIAHTIKVGPRPYQLALSPAFAYVRSLGTERVSMINLAKLGEDGTPPVVTFAAGEKAPEGAADLVIADAIVRAPGEAAVLVVSPGDETVYYYMEGMNAPMGNFRNYGHRPRAVTVVVRALRETAPGFYTAPLTVPEAGTYEIAFLLDAPRILHCFSFVARPNPAIARTGPALGVEFLLKERRVTSGEPVKLRFRLTDRHTGQPKTGLADVQVLHFWGPGMYRTTEPAREVEEGVYEATLRFRRPGAYYVHVLAPPAKNLPFLTLTAEKHEPAAGSGGKVPDAKGTDGEGKTGKEKEEGR
jgi:YVTN family beta-propeller protein